MGLWDYIPIVAFAKGAVNVGDAAMGAANNLDGAVVNAGQAAQSYANQADKIGGAAEQVGNAFEAIGLQVTRLCTDKVLGTIVKSAVGLCAANQLITLAQQLGIAKMPEQNLRIAQLDETNRILLETMENNREDQLVKTAIDWCPRNKLIASGENAEAWFFFSHNNFVVGRLQGLGYWAYNFIDDLFKAVHAFNSICSRAVDNADIAQKHSAVLSQRKTTIIFLDMQPICIPHVVIPTLFHQIEIIQSSRSPGSVQFESIVVEPNCSVTIQYAAIHKIESRGKTLLQRCDMKVPREIPCLFADSSDRWNNQYKIFGDVTFRECDFANYSIPLISRPIKDTQKWFGFYFGGASLYRTIENLTDSEWRARSETLFGNMYLADNAANAEASVPAHSTITIKHTTFQGNIKGTLILTDIDGNEERYNYSTFNLPHWTIIRKKVNLHAL